MNGRRGFACCLLAAAALLGTGGRAEAQVLADYDYENLGFRGVGFDVGYLWPDRAEPAPVYTMRIDLGFLGPGVRIVPSGSYWQSRMKRTELARLADQISRLEVLRIQGVVVGPDDLGTIEWSSASLGVDGQFVWDTALNIQTFIGLGLALHSMNGKGSAIQETFVEDLLDTVTAGVAASAGFEFEPIRVLRFFAEGRYTLLSNVRYPGARLGLTFMLPR